MKYIEITYNITYKGSLYFAIPDVLLISFSILFYFASSKMTLGQAHVNFWNKLPRNARPINNLKYTPVLALNLMSMAMPRVISSCHTIFTSAARGVLVMCRLGHLGHSVGTFGLREKPWVWYATGPERVRRLTSPSRLIAAGRHLRLGHLDLRCGFFAHLQCARGSRQLRLASWVADRCRWPIILIIHLVFDRSLCVPCMQHREGSRGLFTGRSMAAFTISSTSCLWVLICTLIPVQSG